MSAIRYTEILELAEKHLDQLVAFRRHLHQHPEVAFQEYETALFLRNALAAIPGLIVTQPTETSVMARLIGAAAGRVVG